jgi:hypothetical protein
MFLIATIIDTNRVMLTLIIPQNMSGSVHNIRKEIVFNLTTKEIITFSLSAKLIRT